MRYFALIPIFFLAACMTEEIVVAPETDDAIIVSECFEDTRVNGCSARAIYISYHGDEEDGNAFFGIRMPHSNGEVVVIGNDEYTVVRYMDSTVLYSWHGERIGFVSCTYSASGAAVVPSGDLTILIPLVFAGSRFIALSTPWMNGVYPPALDFFVDKKTSEDNGLVKANISGKRFRGTVTATCKSR